MDSDLRTSARGPGRRLRLLRPELEETQRTMEGVRRWVYQGINLKGGDSGRRLQREADAAGRFRALPAAEGGWAPGPRTRQKPACGCVAFDAPRRSVLRPQLYIPVYT